MKPQTIQAPVWQAVLETVTFAFQPIVHIHTGETYGFEALLRRWDHLGFASIEALFDAAWEEGVLLEVNRVLRRKAEELFRSIDLGRETKLFFNLDNRILSEPCDGETIFPELEHQSHWLCLELSERHQLSGGEELFEQLQKFQRRNVSIAIDDFGTGFAGLQLLYDANPDVIKIDRFFISQIHDDQTKRLFVTNLVHMAHTMGILVVAEGVESAQEFYTCRAVGCDFVQGYLVQKPQQELTLLEGNYEVVRSLVQEDRRRYRTTRERILRWAKYTEPLKLDTPVIQVLNRFRQVVSASFFPVVNELGEPVGILREREMKNWVYSPFGISLLMNSSYKHEIASLIARVPIASVETTLEAIVELYALDPEAEAVLLTENGSYRGYLDSRTLVQLIHEKEIERARDENPLTRLPGNTLIREYVGERLSFDERPHLFVYLDFDNFKPFNDLYGFRHGDRVIQLFGDMLKEFGQSTGAFVGHVGGDDFFLGMELSSRSASQAEELIRLLQASFSENAVAFYDEQARINGCIEAFDRGGVRRCFEILTVSGGGLIVPSGRERCVTEEGVLRVLAELKKEGKESPGQLAIRGVSVTIE